MRLLIPLFFIIFSLHAESGRSQMKQVSLNCTNSKIATVLEEIEKQTDYLFFYNHKEIRSEKSVTIKASKEPVARVLDELFKDTDIKYVMLDDHIVLSKKDVEINEITGSKGMTQTQAIIITGRIIDNLGDVVPGASVNVKGTTLGTTTDEDGRYTLSVPNKEAVLKFSFIGFVTKEIVVGNQTVIDITLQEDIAQLEEVVVVGYGVQKKVNLTGAVSVVGSDKLENRPIANATAALQGAAPGLVITRSGGGQPGREGWSPQIRGSSSVNGTDALIVIDGVTMQSGALSLLNPDDIENISLLKDGSAAIYGARAAGGVILVTTKKGRKDKISVEYNGLFSFDKSFGLPGRLDSWKELDMENQARVNSGGGAIWSQQEMDWAKDPNINYIPNANNSDYFYFYNTDSNNSLLKDISNNQSHNISLSGGNEKSQYRFSLGYYGKEGIFKYGPDDYRRINARINYLTQFSKNVSLDTRVSYINTDTKYAVKDPAALFEVIYTTRRILPLTAPGTNFAGDGAKGGGYIAYNLLKDGGNRNNLQNNFDANFTLSVDNIFNALRFRAIYAPQWNFTGYEKEEVPIPLYGPNGFRRNSDQGVVQQARVEKQRASTFYQNSQFLLDYHKDIAKKHVIDVLAGVTAETSRYDYITATGDNLISDQVFSLSWADPTLYKAGDNIQTWGLLSYIGRLNYAYNQKYLFEANIRYDGSSRLAPDKRWNLFPSFQAGWILSEEEWFKNNVKFINHLKLRASWGMMGNTPSNNTIGNYDYIAFLAAGDNYPFNNQINKSFYQKQLASLDKTWEKLQTSNVGVDLGFLRNRLNVSADYYVKEMKDMLASMSYPTLLGVGTGLANLADMKTWGWDLSIGWRDRIMDKRFEYWVNVNVFDNTNKVTRYQGQNVYKSGVNAIIEGLPINTIFGYQADGYFQTADEVKNHTFQNNITSPGDIRYVNQNKDDKISTGMGTKEDHGDLINLGDTNPRYNFGTTLGFAFSGFDFSVFFQGVGKRNILLNSSFVTPYSSSWFQPWDIHADYWTPENPNAAFPRLYLGAQNREASSKWVQNAAYIRLKNLQLGYTIPQRISKKAHLEKIRVYFSGQDLWEQSSMSIKYFDPETPNYNSDLGNSFLYPMYRSFAFGLNLTF